MTINVNDLQEVETAYLPDLDRFSERWNWARGGSASSCVHILDYGDYVYYHAALRAPGDRPPAPGSHEEDATVTHVFQTMTAMVTAKMREGGYELISLSDRAAALRRKNGTPHPEPTRK